MGRATHVHDLYFYYGMCMESFVSLLLIAQICVGPVDIHIFSGEEIDCEFFLNDNPYEDDSEEAQLEEIANVEEE